MYSDIKVSVLCCTFNQVDYVEHTLKSLVNQNTDFKYEILVHDDASRDGTQQVIEKYAKKYPGLIRPIFETENQYSKNVKITEDILLPLAKGKFVAFCEGDDYWIDEKKLQKQYDALVNHPGCDLCACSAIKVDAESEKIIGKIAPSNVDKIISVEEVIKGGGLFVATAGLFFRKEVFYKGYKFREYYQLDYTMQIMGSLRGGLLYLADCMVAYRIASKSSWTVDVNKNIDHWIENNNKIINTLDILNQETEGKYASSIQYAKESHQFTSYALRKEYKNILKNCKDYLKDFSLHSKVMIFLKAYIPFVDGLNEERKKFIGRHKK